MIIKVKLFQEDYGVELRSRKGTRRLSLAVQASGKISLTKPRQVSLLEAKLFIFQKRAWLEQTLKQYQINNSSDALTRQEQEKRHYHKHRERAQQIISSRVKELATRLKIGYNKVSIRNQKTRWGSCSAKGNLSFNYRLIFLDSELMDYVIIHELCHRLEFNHSPKFWQLLSDYSPNYQELRSKLKAMEKEFLV